MRTIAIYGGRFQPGHLGHMSSYDYLVDKFGADNVFVATADSASSEDDPFNFGEKVAMLTKLGIPSSHIVKVRSPYRPVEITKDIGDPEDTALVFALSEKDMSGAEGEKPRFDFKPKKNGEPSYMQPYPGDDEELEPMTKHGYVLITPTTPFNVMGKPAKGATKIRELYRKGNEADRKKIIHDLYGEFDPHIKAIFDKKLGSVEEPRTAVIQEPPFDANVLDTPAPLQRESRELRLARLAEDIKRLKRQISEIRRSNDKPNYIDERDKRKVYW